MSRAGGLIVVMGAAGLAYYVYREREMRELQAQQISFQQQQRALQDSGPEWWQVSGQNGEPSVGSALLGIAAPFIEQGVSNLGNSIFNRNNTSTGGGTFWDRLLGRTDAANTNAAPTSTPAPSLPASGPQGRPSGTGPGGVDFDAHERQYRLPTGYLRRTAEIESSLNPNAQNPRSSAGGLFQFINATARDYGLSNRFDPHQATDAASRLARDNANILRPVLGREPTAAELYLAHQQGGAGARRLLRDPNARAVDVVGQAAVNLNGGNSNMTAGEFAGLWINKFNRGFG